MKKLTEMEIYLLSINDTVCSAWQEEDFSKFKNLSIINDDLGKFLNSTRGVECLVSPANSFGYMDGSYDLAITNWYGNLSVQTLVQNHIKEFCLGEQSICSSIFIETKKYPKYLIHTPTMRIPAKLIDPSIVYHCTRSTLIAALQHDVNSIVVPAFGAAVGGVPRTLVAKMMCQAFNQIADFQAR